MLLYLVQFDMLKLIFNYFLPLTTIMKSTSSAQRATVASLLKEGYSLLVYSGPVRSGFLPQRICNRDQDLLLRTLNHEKPDQDCNQPVYIGSVAINQPVRTGLSKNQLTTSPTGFFTVATGAILVHTENNLQKGFKMK